MKNCRFQSLAKPPLDLRRRGLSRISALVPSVAFAAASGLDSEIPARPGVNWAASAHLIPHGKSVATTVSDSQRSLGIDLIPISGESLLE